MYEHFDHTADLGLRIRARNLNELFSEAAEALTATMIEDLSRIRPSQAAEFRIAGGDVAFLLFDWLKTLLLKFEVDRVLFREFRVEVKPDGLSATARGEPYDPARHPLSHEVKAITYHGLQVEQSADGNWLAEAIVDI
jgi:SHS2 domain-containing protein